MVSIENRSGLLPFFLVGLISILPSGNCQQVDITKVTLSGAYYTLFRCANDLNVPTYLTDLYKKLIFPDDQRTCCVFRCLGMRLGIYDDVNGLDVDKQYEGVKDRLSIDEDTFKRGLRKCIRDVLNGRTLNDCERAYLIINGCQGGMVTQSLLQQLAELNSCS